jgi:hypothetical protein
MVRPGATVATRPDTHAFHDAKFAVYSTLHADAKRIRATMDKVAA